MEIASAKRSRGIEGSERTSHRGLDRLLDSPFVDEPNLCLCRMHVYIHRGCRQSHRKKQRRTQAGGDRGPVSRFCGAHDSDVPHRSPVYRDKNSAGSSADVCRTLDQTRRVNDSTHVVDVEKRSRILPAPDAADPRAKRRHRRKRKNLLAIVRQRESDVGPRQRDAAKHVDDRPPLRARAAKEFFSRRRVEEYLRDAYGRSTTTGRG